MKVKSLSRVPLFTTPQTAARQAPLSMGFPRQEHWSGLPFPPPRDLPHPGVTLTGGFFTTEPPGKSRPTEARDFSGGSDDKESSYNMGDSGLIPGSGKSLEKEMETHSGILAWEIPWTEEPGGLQSLGSQKYHTGLSN